MSCTCQIDRPFFIEGFVAFPVLTRTHCPPAFLFAVVGVEPSKPTVVWKTGFSFTCADRRGTLIIVDWDDTIFPTSWLQKKAALL